MFTIWFSLSQKQKFYEMSSAGMGIDVWMRWKKNLSNSFFFVNERKRFFKFTEIIFIHIIFFER